MEFRILGPIEAREDAREVGLGGPKQRALLAILLLSANEVVSRDRLIDELWGERPPPSAAHTLDAYVHRLRRALGARGAEILRTRAPGYLISISSADLDLHRFRLLADEGGRALAAGSHEVAAATLRQALALWRGPALADLAHEPFARIEVDRLDELRLAVLEDRIEADLALGRQAALVEELRALIAEHPLRERFRAELMLAQYRAGCQADALQTYREAREYLVEELGLEPSKLLQDLDRAILRQDDELDPGAGGSSPVLVASPPSVDGDGNGAAADGSAAGNGLRGAPPTEGAVRTRKWLVVGGALGLVGALVLGGAALLAGDSDALEAGAVRSNAVVFVDPADRELVSQTVAEGRPAGIAVGEGAVWVTDASTGEVLRLNPGTREIEDRIPVVGEPGDVAVGSGSVWVLSTPSGAVSEINPSAHRVVGTVRVGNGPTAIAYGEGAVWVADATDGTVTRIDPRRGAVAATVRVEQPLDDVAVGYGGVWVTSAASGLLVRIDPATDGVTQSIPVGNGPSAIAVAGGDIWVSNPPDATVSRVDPGTGVVRKVSVESPGSLAVAGGELWVSETQRPGLALVDPATGGISERVATGNPATAIAASDDALAVVTGAGATAHTGGTLRVVAEGGLDSIDPGTSWSIFGWELLSMTHAGLVTYAREPGPAGSTIVPDLATAVPPPRDHGRTYTFQIRRGLRYSTDEPVRVGDFRTAVEREYAATRGLAALGVPLVGAAACMREPERCDLSRGISVDEASRTVSFHLTEPDPSFLYELALPFGAVVPSNSPPIDAARRPLPATGPYSIRRYIRDREVLLVRNPEFREQSPARSAGFPDRIRLRLGVSPERQVKLVRTGAADLMLDSPPPDALATLVRREPLRAHPYFFPEVHAMFMNVRRAPFDRLSVRRAVNLAVDRNAIVKIEGGHHLAQPTCQILPPGFPGYRPLCPHTTNPNAVGAWRGPDLARARGLIRESGTAGMTVAVSTPLGDPVRFRTAKYFVGLLDRLGYRAGLRTYPSDAPYFEKVGRPATQSQIGIFPWVADYPAGSSFFVPLFSCDPFSLAEFRLNAAGFCDRGVDSQIAGATALESTNSTAANAAWQEVDAQITGAAPWVPLVNTRGVDFVSERVGNYQRNPTFGTLLDQLWVR